MITTTLQRRFIRTAVTRPVGVSGVRRSLEHHRGGRFVTPWASSFQGNVFPAFLKMLALDWDKGNARPVTLPSREPDWNQINYLAPTSHNGALVTWIGHSSFLIQANGWNILTDPVFNERASPVQWFGPKRIMPIPVGSIDSLIELLPAVDLVLLSHNHYDHMCKETIDALEQAFHPNFFVPLGVKSWMRSRSITNVVEMDWWETCVSTSPAKVDQAEVINLPVQHLTARSMFDRGETLCSSYLVKLGDHKLYFTGDTGYRNVPRLFKGDERDLPHCPAFKEIGDRLGPIDLALIPIGAYSPRWFMSSLHLSPEDAIDVHRDLKSRKSIGMHWGTFKLTDEPVDEPPRRLKAAAQREGLAVDEFTVMAHGETRFLQFQSEHAKRSYGVNEATTAHSEIISI